MVPTIPKVSPNLSFQPSPLKASTAKIQPLGGYWQNWTHPFLLPTPQCPACKMSAHWTSPLHFRVLLIKSSIRGTVPLKYSQVSPVITLLITTASVSGLHHLPPGLSKVSLLTTRWFPWLKFSSGLHSLQEEACASSNVTWGVWRASPCLCLQAHFLTYVATPSSGAAQLPQNKHRHLPKG